jgi:threonyl-tRNA synthetase
MRLITLHCDYIKFKPLKKALGKPEELSDERKKEIEVKEPLVVLTAVEKGDDDSILNKYVESIEKTAKDVKAERIVLYPYAHLSSNLSSPDVAVTFLEDAEKSLKKKKFEIVRAPFGYYKEFELKCKGHPLSELSKEFRNESSEEVKVKEVSESREKDISKLLRELKTTRLDTSKLKENDHRIIGQKLDLFSFNEASPGSVFWHPKGLVIYNELQKFSREVQEQAGYQEVSTPQIYDNKLWKVSGHWEHYKNDMFLTDYEGKSAAVKPMNCPGHYLFFRNKPRSYRDLPLRLSEYSPLHRMELSGVLAGLFRVIRLHQDDSHIFVSEEQLQDEIINVINLFKLLLDKFGFKYKFTLSVRSEEKKDKYLGDDKLWKKAEADLEKALKKLDIKFERNPGEAKFYGPSLDVVIRDSLDREWQCSTLQIDFNAPERFEMEYIDDKGKAKRPIVLHRAAYGSLERFMGILIEHLNGVFPTWLSPIQVRVINFTDRNNDACIKLVSEIKEKIPGIRIDNDLRNTTVSDKVRDAEMQKIPYIIVIGDKEEQAGTLAVRARGKKPEFGVSKQDFIEKLSDEIRNRK